MSKAIKKSLLGKIAQDCESKRIGIEATYDVDELLIKLVGNLTLRDVALSPVERVLLDAAIHRLSEARESFKAIDPTLYVTY